MRLREISKEELNKILEKHKRWLKGEPDGELANLSRVDLSGADLNYVDLRGANLSFADLGDANIRCADLRDANLSYADLSDTNLSCADLSYANLSSADLSHADLSFADLSCTDLSRADLSFADLSHADLSYADLSCVDLSGADLRYADLLIFQFQRHTAYFTLDGTLRIGCECMPISEWLIGYKQVGKCHGYTDREIKAYGQFIKMCAEMFKEANDPRWGQKRSWVWNNWTC